MKTIIFIKGKQGTGKSILAETVKDSVEVQDMQEATLAMTKRRLFSKDVAKNVIFTYNDKSAYNQISENLKFLAKANNRLYFEILVDEFFNGN